jgi:hypothetical protein
MAWGHSIQSSKQKTLKRPTTNRKKKLEDLNWLSKGFTNANVRIEYRHRVKENVIGVAPQKSIGSDKLI